jgi:hypothetical protein
MLFGLVAVALLAYCAFGWFVLVSPKRSAAAGLEQEVAAAESAVVAARAALATQHDAEPVAVADIFRLATAMPAVADMPGILLELARLAEETGIEFDSVAPGASTAATDFQQVPISLVFDGSFYELSDFLFRLRTLVGVRAGELHATGRLFSVESLSFIEADRGFPELTANLTVNAYVFGTGAAASPLPEAAPPAGEATAAPNESVESAEGSP